MWKLIFGAIITIFVIGGVFFLGYVAGTTVTPLDCGAVASATVNTLAVPHATV